MKNDTQHNNMHKVNNGLASALGIENPTQEIYANANPFLLSLNWVPLANTYKDNGFAKLAVDLPVSDAFRNGGFKLESGTLSAEELEELEQELIEKGDIEAVKQAIRWGRLYGGGLLICSTNQQPDTPFNPETIYNKPLEFLACDRWQCYPMARSLYMAEQFMLQDNTMGDNGNNIIYDKSRIKTFIGEVQPYYIRNMLQGWGASIFEAIVPQLTQYLKANSVILELLDEAKIDILKISGLADLLMSAEGEQAVKRRVEVFARNKNYKNMGAMDTEDDYIQKTMSFAGLNELLEKIFLLICSSLRIPYSKVFGRGASGFSSGEDDLENYNAMVMADIRVPATPMIKWVAQIRACQLFGRKVDDLKIEWLPLRVLSDKEEQEIRNGKVNSLLQLLQAGVLNRKQVAEELTKNDIIAFSDEEINALLDNEEFEEIEEEEKEIVENSFLNKVRNAFNKVE